MKLVKFKITNATHTAHALEKWAYGYRDKNGRWVRGLVNQDDDSEVDAVETAINTVYVAEEDGAYSIELELPDKLAARVEATYNNWLGGKRKK